MLGFNEWRYYRCNNTPLCKSTSFTSNGCFNRTATTPTVITIAGELVNRWGGAGGVLVTECHPLPTCAVPVTVIALVLLIIVM